MTTRVIKIVIDSKGAKKGGKDVENALGGVEKKSEGAAKGIGSVGKAIGAAALVTAAIQIVKIGDAWASLQGQLRLVTDSQAELNSTTQTLFDISQRTRQSIDATASLYVRLGRSTDFANERIAQLTETIGQTIAISRAAPEAAKAALFQLGQGFAAGALRGEELNSVMEQTPELAKAIAEGMGKTIGQLRILGAEGKLTAEAVAAGLEASAESVNTDFAEVPLTVGDAITKVGNSLTKFIGQLDQSIGATSLLAQTINTASEVITGLNIILTDDKGFGAKAGLVGKQIEAMRVTRKGIEDLLKSRGIQQLGPDSEVFKNLNAELETTKTKISELSQLQQELIQNGGLTNAEVEVKNQETLRTEISRTIEKAHGLFELSLGVSPIAAAAKDAEEQIEKLRKAVEKGFDPAEAKELEKAIRDAFRAAEGREADVFVNTFKDAADKAKDSLALLNDFVARNLIDEDTATKIREKLAKALSGGDTDQELADKFAEQFKTATEKAEEQIVQLDDFVEKELISEETALKIRARLDEIIAEELVIEIKADVQAVIDTEQRIADLQDRIAAFNEGGAAALSSTESFQEARDLIAEMGDEATISVTELTRLIETEKQLSEVLDDQIGKHADNADAIEDFFKRARENSQDILADMFENGFKDLDEFGQAFSLMLLQLASQALAADIFGALLGDGGDSGGGAVSGIIGAIGSFFGGAANGKDVGQGDFGVVGENGPEMFQAPTAGRIVPNGANQAAPQVSVGGPTIINTIDDSDIVSAFNRGGGNDVILNNMTENAGAFRQALGIN